MSQIEVEGVGTVEIGTRIPLTDARAFEYKVRLGEVSGIVQIIEDAGIPRRKASRQGFRIWGAPQLTDEQLDAIAEALIRRDWASHA